MLFYVEIPYHFYFSCDILINKSIYFINEVKYLAISHINVFFGFLKLSKNFSYCSLNFF
jgi:hypothetical protein